MKSGDIIQLTTNSGLLNDESEKQLKSLLEDYPYFQTARLLYLMNLHSGKDSEFGSELKKTACYAVDRKKMYFLVKGEQFVPIRINRLEKVENTLQLESSFDLIDFFLNEKTGYEEESEVVPAVSGNKSEDLIATDYLSYLLSDEVKHSDQPVVPMLYQDTIDEFLRRDAEEPVKIRLKDAAETVEEPVDPNLVPLGEDDFFSETLAKIYVRQKKYDKALEIIRKLHLLYPEKNIYFADQIRFLEKLIINIKK
jgi:tetratricopeptide (TPR) repeat protein